MDKYPLNLPTHKNRRLEHLGPLAAVKNITKIVPFQLHEHDGNAQSKWHDPTRLTRLKFPCRNILGYRFEHNINTPFMVKVT